MSVNHVLSNHQFKNWKLSYTKKVNIEAVAQHLEMNYEIIEDTQKSINQFFSSQHGAIKDDLGFRYQGELLERFHERGLTSDEHILALVLAASKHLVHIESYFDYNNDQVSDFTNLVRTHTTNDFIICLTYSLDILMGAGNEDDFKKIFKKLSLIERMVILTEHFKEIPYDSFTQFELVNDLFEGFDFASLRGESNQYAVLYFMGMLSQIKNNTKPKKSYYGKNLELYEFINAAYKFQRTKIKKNEKEFIYMSQFINELTLEFYNASSILGDVFQQFSGVFKEKYKVNALIEEMLLSADENDVSSINQGIISLFNDVDKKKLIQSFNDVFKKIGSTPLTNGQVKKINSVTTKLSMDYWRDFDYMGESGIHFDEKFFELLNPDVLVDNQFNQSLFKKMSCAYLVNGKIVNIRQEEYNNNYLFILENARKVMLKNRNPFISNRREEIGYESTIYLQKAFELGLLEDSLTSLMEYELNKEFGDISFDWYIKKNIYKYSVELSQKTEDELTLQVLKGVNSKRVSNVFQNYKIQFKQLLPAFIKMIVHTSGDKTEFANSLIVFYNDVFKLSPFNEEENEQFKRFVQKYVNFLVSKGGIKNDVKEIIETHFTDFNDVLHQNHQILVDVMESHRTVADFNKILFELFKRKTALTFNEKEETSVLAILQKLKEVIETWDTPTFTGYLKTMRELNALSKHPLLSSEKLQNKIRDLMDFYSFDKKEALEDEEVLIIKTIYKNAIEKEEK